MTNDWVLIVVVLLFATLAIGGVLWFLLDPPPFVVNQRPMVIGPPKPMPGINILPYEDDNGDKGFEIHARHWDVGLLLGEKAVTLYDGDTFLLTEDLEDVTFRLKTYHPPK